MKYQGKLTNWDDDKGFGFVEPKGGGARAFVHIKSFLNRSRRPVDGDVIVYEQVDDSRGRYKAINVSLLSDRKKRLRSRSTSGKADLLLVWSFCILLVSITYLKLLPVEIMYLYVAASILAFVVYALDKSAAQNNRWRTPESHLHLLALVGGWPGACFAQNMLRHKSSKQVFKRGYWATVIINMCAFFWLFSEQGQQVLGTIVG